MWPIAGSGLARVIQHEAWPKKLFRPQVSDYYEKGGRRPKENQGCIDVKCILLILTNLAASESRIKTN